WIDRILRRRRHATEADERLVHIYTASVEQCFLPLDFNDELPLYFLDVGGFALSLFGQWLYDPHVSKIPASVFNKWDCERAFFSSFSLRCSAKTGVVLRFEVRG